MCVCAPACVCVYVCARAPPFTNDILRCLQALCLHFAFFQALLFKNQSPANDRPQETVERITLPLLPPSLSLSFSLSCSLSSIPLFYPSLFLSARKVSLFYPSPPPPSPLPPPPPPLPRPWLKRVASECQMYYRVSHGNVNTQPCHESRVVWPPSFPSLPSCPSLPSSPFLSSLPHSADCQRGGESTKQQRGECMCVCVCWGV